MRKRMYALLLAGVLTFSQSGMIVLAGTAESGSGQQIATQADDVTVTVNKPVVDAIGDYSVIFKASTGTIPTDYSFQDADGNELEEGKDYFINNYSLSKLVIEIPENEETTEREFNLVINGKVVATVTQKGKVEEGKAPLIQQVDKKSQTKLPDGRTQVVYNVTGSNLKEVGVKVKEGFSYLSTSKYTVVRSGEGNEQLVTVTLPANTDPFDTNYTINFYNSSTDTTAVAVSDTVTIKPAEAETTEPAITDVTVDKSESEWNEGTFNVTVKGKNLTSDLDVKVLDAAGLEVSEAKAGKISGTAEEQTFSVEIPDNVDTTDKSYTISVNAKGQTDKKTASVTVKGKDWMIGQKISKITASQTEIPNADRTVEFTLEGENLSHNTAFKVLKDGSKQDLSSYNIKIEGKGTTQKVTMTFPENTGSEDEAYTVNFYPDGSLYSGFKKYQVKVLKEETETPAISALEVDKNHFESTGGTAAFTVRGTHLDNLPDGKPAVKVFKNGVEDKTLTPEFPLGMSTALKEEFHITFPQNTETEDVVYTVKVAASADAAEADWKEAKVTVAGEEKEGKVTGITVTPTEIGKDGGKVQLKVEGTNLTAKNWNVEVKTFVAKSDVDRTQQYPATVSDITADGATITIPENGMVNNLEYRITAGALKDGTVQSQATAKVVQEGGDKRETLTVSGAYLTDDNKVVVDFAENVAVAKSAEDLKSKISLTGYKAKDAAEPGALGTSDTVEVNGKTLTITLNTEYKAKAGSQVSIGAGALKLVDRDATILNRDVAHSLTHKATVKQINFEKDVFDYKGGTVVAKLSGVRLEELEEGSIEATITNPGTLKTADIPVQVSYGAEPTVEFTVPENTTDATQSYLLSLKVNGENVYEVDGSNLARRAIVSVLPKGAKESDQTLSSMTITGNNKLDVGDPTKITVTVEKQVGSLKTVLRLSGTNLDSTKTEVRAIDENGIIWPVYHIPECDGSWRFVAIDGINKNGVIGDGNSQFVEILPPRYAGTNKTYKIQVALDGVHFLDAPTVELTVDNSAVKGQEDEWVDCGKEDIVNIKAKYIDQKTGKEIAEADNYEGYPISMYRQFDIGAKEIPGYKLVKGPNMDEYKDLFYRNKPVSEFVFEYVSEKEVKTGWQKIDGKWYYMDENGEAKTDWQQVDGKWYYMDKNGVMQTGWQQVDGKWYYMDKNGVMQTGWQKVDGKWYYMNGSGAMLTGWQKVDGKWYYMNTSGAMQTGWQKVDGKWYYMNGSGAMLTGWQKIGGKWYYMNTSGAMQTGWLKLGNQWYYLNVSGAMVTGRQKIGGKWYRFNASGVWIK